MPTDTQPATSPIEAFVELGFSNGMDASRSPESMPPGTLQSLVNGMVVGSSGRGSSGGKIQTRPGRRALLASALGGAIAVCKRFRKPDGTRVMMLSVADASSTTGHIYYWQKGATSAVSLSSQLGLFNSYAVQFSILGKYVFIIGATDGKMRRYDLSGTTDPGAPTGTGIATGEQTPTTAPLVSLTNGLIDTVAAGTNWVIDHFSGSPNDVINGSFAGGGSFPGGYSGWVKLPGSVIECAQPLLSFGDATYFVRLDDQPSSIQSINVSAVAALANTAVVNSYYTGGALPARYATHIVFGATYYTDAAGVQDGVSVTVILYSDTAGLVEIARQTRIFSPGTTLASVQIGGVFDFSYIDPALPLTYSVILGAGPKNRSGSNGPYLTAIHCSPYLPTGASVAAGSGAASAQTLVYLPNGANAQDEKNTLFLGNLRISHDLGSGLDLSGYQALALTFSQTSPLGNVRVRLVLRSATTALGVTTDVATLAQDSTGQTFLFVNISAIPAGSRNSVRYIDFLFLSDIPFQAGYTNGGQPFALGPLTNPGGKSINTAYTFRFTESTGTVAAGVYTPGSEIESGGSPLSAEVLTDGLHATIQLILPAPTNGNADAYNIYVEGGTFVDGFFHQESVLPIATGLTWPGLTWNGGTGVYTGTNVTWNPTTRVYTTSVTDNAVELATLFTDHQPAPSPGTIASGLSPTAIEVFQNRLVLGVGRDVYISALTTGVSTGLYWNFVPDPSAANFAVQGNRITVGGLEGTTIGDAIRRIRVTQNRAVIYFENVLFLLGGIDNRDFAVREFAPEKNVGLVAANAVAVADGSAFFLSSSGLHAFDLRSLDRDIAMPIARLLNPAGEFAGDALSAAAYTNASLIAHAGRLLLSAPTASSGSAIATTYVLDLRLGGIWYQWNLGAVLCGDSFSGSGDTDDLVVGCSDGMLYSLGNAYGDTTTSAASPTAVTMTWTTREYISSDAAMHDLYAQRFGATFSCADTTFTPTFTVFGDSPAGQTWSLAYTAAAGETTLRPPLKVSSNARGATLTMGGSVATVNPFALQKLELIAGKGRRS